ncbi:Glycerophosphoryl diester phosphodiesterase [Pedococcus cremeus]|uniref:Altered inheritance of mitochondria protein 6 n=1 Tax=Pedococcus cremeus TaxID=587636 RepID=A0A1H9XPU9_9MICO|nr:phosphatidylinositol-specific phospholipase C/glycerophosphodiester phosphodiesterase family protein [Pedococcus cremeus]SES48180.1 Glycerophosphoryl diester phosphodiesterase [Pedococcus cremeus]
MRTPTIHRIPGVVTALFLALAAAVALPAAAPAATVVATPHPARSTIQPLERAHAHNDYEHDRPLFDALDHGFTSVEADVWLVDGQLYIGHDGPDPSRTLASTYLDPLRQRFRENSGSIYPGWRDSLRLLVDVKSEGTAAWPVIERELARYPELFTAARRGRVQERAVTAVISGNRDLAAMEAAPVRRSFYDGRLSDLGSGLPATVMPLVSDNWTKHFTWLGVGPMPESERTKLHQIVQRAHAAGYEVRFWATPDVAGPARDAVWSELVAAGVDALNTDDLAGLQSFLLAHDPQEAAPAA